MTTHGAPEPPQAEHWLKAARSADEELLRKLAKSPGADINVTDVDGQTALHLAILDHDDTAANQLLRHGADPNGPTPDGREPIFLAAEGGSAGTVRLLLDRGAHFHPRLLDVAKDNEEMTEILNREAILRRPRIRHHTQAIEAGWPPAVPNDRDRLVACRGFKATIMDFFTEPKHEHSPPKTVSVYDLLYGPGPKALRSPPENPKNKLSFTWYHLPANNVCFTSASSPWRLFQHLTNP